MHAKTIATAALLGLAACAHEQPAASPASSLPAWTRRGSGPCLVEEFKGKLCARGVAAYAEIPNLNLRSKAAGNRARDEVSRVFQTKMRVFTSDGGVSRAKASEGADAWSKFEDGVKSTSQRSVEGVVIAELYEDKDGGATYALAVLDTDTMKGALKASAEAARLNQATVKEIDDAVDRVFDDMDVELHPNR